MSCKRVPPGDWWLSDQRSAPRNIKAEVRPVRAAAGLSPCLPTVGKMPCTKTLPGSSCPKERLFTSLSLQAPPPAPQKGGLPTSAAGQYICDGLQGWPWLRLIPDVDPPGMCLLSNCPASEGSHRPPLRPPLSLLHPSESVQHVEAFLLSHSLCRNSHSRDQGQPGGGPHSPPAWSVELGSRRSQPIPLLFFWVQALGVGAEGETLENSLEVKEFGSQAQAPLIPGPSWECH